MLPLLAAALASAALAAPPALSAAAQPLDPSARGFLRRHCAACHSGAAAQAGVRLDAAEVDWREPEAAAHWERVFNALSRGAMPPADAPRQPAEAERRRMTAWLDARLREHAPAGGAVPRRLNRREYENTIRDLFDLPEFRVPDSFPADDSAHGFDNVAEGLILSPPLLAQLLESATRAADEVLPPGRGPAAAESKHYEIGAAGLAAGEGSKPAAGRFRLASSRNMANAAVWPKRFEAPASGVYRLSIEAAAFQTDKMFYPPRSEPLRLAVYAKPKAEQVYDPLGKLRKLAVLDVPPDAAAPRALTVDIELFKGEAFGLHWQNGPAFSDPPAREYSITFLAERLRADRLYYAAMLAYVGGPRGATQKQIYDDTAALMKSGKLDLSDPRLDKMPERWGGGLANAPHNWIKAFVQEEMHRFGPALDLTAAAVEGPLRLIDDDETRARKARKQRFLGARPDGASDREYAETVLRRFLSRAFRRPASDEQVAAYADLAAQAESLEAGLHPAVRRALVSPHFLYRGLRPGRLDDFDLASRLSYFLTSSPPDARLAAAARAGELADPDVLERETLRLLAAPKSRNFVSSFTGQWLGTRLLEDIMPDPRLLKFIDHDRRAMIDETEMFFAEIIRENHPVETFLDPGFSYRSARLNKIYGGDLEGNHMRRITFARGGRHGGILGLAAVAMATANGVDTHPVERGVWLLENVFGEPPPPPPPNVPAIAPDTSGAASMREQLRRHRSDPSCASCHKRIDPLGMVMENFDPVGRWRGRYPRYTQPPDGAEALKEEFYSSIGRGVAPGPPVDAVGVMPDGARLEDVTDLKRYLLDRPDVFARCLTEKLLVYACGRPLTYGDRRAAARIVAEMETRGRGFRGLIAAVVRSSAFRIR